MKILDSGSVFCSFCTILLQIASLSRAGTLIYYLFSGTFWCPYRCKITSMIVKRSADYWANWCFVNTHAIV